MDNKKKTSEELEIIKEKYLKFKRQKLESQRRELKSLEKEEEKEEGKVELKYKVRDTELVLFITSILKKGEKQKKRKKKVTFSRIKILV